jgi:hypothetical protein
MRAGGRMSKEPEFYRPDESDRLARAKEWLRVARGGERPPRKADLMTATPLLNTAGREKSDAE